MSINFNSDRWNHVIETHALWWEGGLGRPIISVTVSGGEPSGVMPRAPLLSQETCADFTHSPEDIIDRIDYELSKQTYYGDAFPRVNLDSFGPGIVAAFCGAVLDNSSGRVWFYPPDNMPDITELHFEYDSSNKWLCRIKDICAAGMKRWQGNVLIGMPDLGGVLDILASFRTTEQLLYDLYDYPQEVKRLANEIADLWIKYFDEINSVLLPVSKGYTNWSGMYSDKPSYILQNDFSYMIGSDMFEEFSKPNLVFLAERLENGIYHLDGTGELPHLDSLMKIDNIKCIQWVPGDGKPGLEHWPEVYQKIEAAGKKIMLFGNDNVFGILRAVGGQIDDISRIYLVGSCPRDCSDEYIIEQLALYALV